ncbi:MAG: hypothetical protein K2M47_06685 [Clostridiales bacterium]|nr:hypothetical protein [Clostridiales bacterium]
MIGKKDKPAISFDDKMRAAKYDCIHKALKEILSTEVKITNPTTNKEEVNFAQTVSVIKTRARLALEFVTTLDKNSDDN